MSTSLTDLAQTLEASEAERREAGRSAFIEAIWADADDTEALLQIVRDHGLDLRTAEKLRGQSSQAMEFLDKVEALPEAEAAVREAEVDLKAAHEKTGTLDEVQEAVATAERELESAKAVRADLEYARVRATAFCAQGRVPAERIPPAIQQALDRERRDQVCLRAAVRLRDLGKTLRKIDADIAALERGENVPARTRYAEGPPARAIKAALAKAKTQRLTILEELGGDPDGD